MSFAVVLLVTFALFAAVAGAMAIGLIFRGKCIRGSCGGEAILGPDGEILNCDTCPARKNRERIAATSDSGTRISAAQHR